MYIVGALVEIGEESATKPQQPVSIDEESNQQLMNDARYSADNSTDANYSNSGENNVVMQEVVSAVGLFKTAQFLLTVCVCVCVCLCMCAPVCLSRIFFANQFVLLCFDLCILYFFLNLIFNTNH